MAAGQRADQGTHTALLRVLVCALVIFVVLTAEPLSESIVVVTVTVAAAAATLDGGGAVCCVTAGRDGGCLCKHQHSMHTYTYIGLATAHTSFDQNE